MVNGKPRISDEQTLREMQFAEACEELVAAEREFAEWDAKATKKWAHPDADPANLCQWFDALERRYKADRLVATLHRGRPLRTSQLPLQLFRRHLLRRTARSYGQTHEQSAAAAVFTSSVPVSDIACCRRYPQAWQTTAYASSPNPRLSRRSFPLLLLAVALDTNAES